MAKSLATDAQGQARFVMNGNTAVVAPKTIQGWNAEEAIRKVGAAANAEFVRFENQTRTTKRPDEGWGATAEKQPVRTMP